jgi:hypothetical protein
MRRPALSVMVALFVSLCVSPPARAQRSNDPTASPTLDTRGSIAFNQSTPQAYFAFIAKTLKLDAQVDPRLTKPVSIRLDWVTVRTMLNTACEGLGCRWKVDGARLIVDWDEAQQALARDDTKERELTDAVNRIMVPPLAFHAVPLRTALTLAVERSTVRQCRVALAKDFGDPIVNVDLTEKSPLLDALRAILSAAGINAELAVTGSLRNGSSVPDTCAVIVIKKRDAP